MLSARAGFELHDATLEEISFDWTQGTAYMRIKSGSRGALVLVATGVHSLEVSRHQPWGESVSINEVRGPEPRSNGLHQIEIEMQSGDTITVRANAFEIQPIAEQ